ncbi:right-handed parallel beta-helix repeat-containing protein [Lysinibacillus sp. 2017]|uniref:right-handed parallel beta-helix repeat-containing protein n=1 Tax=unclassified Lysinibacillus TaxID=2636778 RepID=UPI000D527E6C|nr:MULTISPECIES: right-handed parallel beta-helix repeat-containing protein [unclassified Lysinibacillus]AWE07558.1 right-handed parallel beta-helix repeat-containing protein [Lysinibacillus sp. 2017]TGN36721.1 right-handed parallel beta-helix repeat-containing protein [Lysinibacillus sp. S2017]
MAIIKVSTSVFSKFKTVERALQKALHDDEILLAAGKYVETITIKKQVTITAKVMDHVFLEGVIFIPKASHVTFKNLTIHPTTQLFVEGTITLTNCTFIGAASNVLLSLNNGRAFVEKCHFSGASDVGVVLINHSYAEFENCYFENNEKSHLLLDQSTAILKNCELLKSQHAIWLKSDSKINTENVKIHHHSGTQIIVQDQSTFIDYGSSIEHGEGNGLFASEKSMIELNSTVIQHHQLPQLWIQKSQLNLSNCQIQHGKESGLMLREFSEGTITNTLFAYHKIANVQLTLESLLNMTDSQIHSCQGVGVQVKEKSIINFINTTFADNVLPQLFVTEKSICTVKEATIKNGKQVGVFVEKDASCSIVDSHIINHENTAITVIGAELFILDSDISQNKGNGILVVNESTATIENCTFNENNMPHIAGKEKASVSISQSKFTGGKSVFMVENCSLNIKESEFLDGTGVQIEIVGQTRATIHKSKVSGGKSNAIKVMKDAMLQISESQISTHKLPQIVVNDSSIIFKNNELLQGDKNGFIIENHSEVLIQDSFISNHRYPQIWIDLHSTVDLKSTQLTEGQESDIYVQNNSTVHASNCIIQNDKFQFNIQAVNHSKINLVQSTVGNSIGDTFYSENNSEITHNLDEVN